MARDIFAMNTRLGRRPRVHFAQRWALSRAALWRNRMLARATALAWGVAATHLELLGKALLYQVVDRGMERVQAAELFAFKFSK